jgi:DNA-binding NarL/FixJ family response regulator
VTRPAWVHRFTAAELRGNLTGAELQLLRLIERNLPNKGIATHLGISEGEVTSRMTRLHQTLGLTRANDNPRLAVAAGARTPR